MPLIAESTVNSEQYWRGLYERGEYPTRNASNVNRYRAAAARQVGNTALDIGCGQGGLGLSLFEAFPNVHYTGWDYAQSAIDTAIIPKAAQAELECRDWREGSQAGQWDTVYLLELLEHELEPRELAEVAVALARKRIVVTVPRCGVLSLAEHRSEHHWDFDPEEIRALFAGYGDVRGPIKANHLCDLYMIDRLDDAGATE